MSQPIHSTTGAPAAGASTGLSEEKKQEVIDLALAALAQVDQLQHSLADLGTDLSNLQRRTSCPQVPELQEERVKLRERVNRLEQKYPGALAKIEKAMWDYCLTDAQKTEAAMQSDADTSTDYIYKYPVELNRAIDRVIYSTPNVDDATVALFKAFYVMERMLVDIGEETCLKRLPRMREANEDTSAIKEHVDAFLGRLPVATRNAIFGEMYQLFTPSQIAKAEGQPTYAADHYMDHLPQLEMAVRRHVPGEFIQNEALIIYRTAYLKCLSLLENEPLAMERDSFRGTTLTILMRLLEKMDPSNTLFKYYKHYVTEIVLFDRYPNKKFPTLERMEERNAQIARFRAKIMNPEFYRLSFEIIDLIQVVKKTYDKKQFLKREDLEILQRYMGNERYVALLNDYYNMVKDWAQENLNRDPALQEVLDSIERDPQWALNNIFVYDAFLRNLLEKALRETAKVAMDQLEPGENLTPDKRLRKVVMEECQYNLEKNIDMTKINPELEGFEDTDSNALSDIIICYMTERVVNDHS